MKQMINEYLESCRMAKNRIKELTLTEKELRKSGKLTESQRIDLDRRIKLLYVEHGEMMEVVNYLAGCVREVEKRAKI
ncbi:MAG TPA: hypothetical protein DCZ71_05440 [Ruminococcus sp.]|nr:hypothetical protein [Ruminococcus sp.]